MQIDTSSQPLLQKEESWKVQMDLFIKQQAFQTCCSCKLNITPNEEME